MKRVSILFLTMISLGVMGINNKLQAPTYSSKNITINAQVKQTLWIWMQRDTINFPPRVPKNPPSWDEIPANENPVTISVTARVHGNTTTVLNVLANGDLESGQERIPISNISWTATNVHSSNGTFLDGTMSATEPQLAGKWRTSGRRTGSLNYFYYNDPRPPGNYTQTVTYTLVSF